jgi:hypothetical protein
VLLPAPIRASLSGRAGRAGAIAGASLALALALACCRYAHPALDDYGVPCQMAAHGWWWNQADYRARWGGRFTSSGFCLAALAHLDLLAYRLLCAAQIVALALAAAWCARALPLLAGRSALAALAAEAAWLATLDRPSESLFWVSGWANYQLGLIFDLLAIGALLRARAWAWAAAGAGLAALAAGCSEVTAAPLAVVLALGAARAWRERSARSAWLAAAAAFAAAFAFAALAPGNLVRFQVLCPSPHRGALALAAVRALIAPAPLAFGALARAPIAAAALAAGLLGWARGDARGARAGWGLAACWLAVAAAHAPTLLVASGVPVRAANAEHAVVVAALLAAAALLGAALRALWNHPRLQRLSPSALWALALGAPLVALASAWVQYDGYQDRAAMIDLLGAAAIIAATPWRRGALFAQGEPQRAGLAIAAVGCLWCSDLANMATDLVEIAPSWNRQQLLRDAFCRRPELRRLDMVQVPAIARVPLTISPRDPWLIEHGGDWLLYARWNGLRGVREVDGLAWSADGAEVHGPDGRIVNAPAAP